MWAKRQAITVALSRRNLHGMQINLSFNHCQKNWDFESYSNNSNKKQLHQRRWDTKWNNKCWIFLDRSCILLSFYTCVTDLTIIIGFCFNVALYNQFWSNCFVFLLIYILILSIILQLNHNIPLMYWKWFIHVIFDKYFITIIISCTNI